MVLVEIPNEYGYVLLAATSTFFVNIWHGTQTVKARKASGIGYPNTYASAEEAKEGTPAYQLNCAQRAHANFTENLTPFMANLFIAGLGFPVAAAGLGFGWLISRIVYTVGYTSSRGPKGRVLGSFGHYLCGFGLALTAGYSAVQLIRGQ